MRETVLLDGIRFKVVRVQQPSDRGELQRDVVRHPGSVVILPMVDENRVCLIRNYRVAVDESLVELPAGTLELDEEPETTARRELIEETGFRASGMTQLHSFYAAPGCLDERMTLYLATELTSGRPQPEIGEQIENLIVDWDEALDMVQSGQICDAKTIIGLLLYDRMRFRS